MPQLPQPLTISRTREEIARDFVTLTIDRCPDPRWHFKTAAHRQSRLGPQGDICPSAEHPMQTLALLARRDPVCDIEIQGFLMPREFHPADWLDLWLENQKLTVQSRRVIPMSPASGDCGDCVCTWEVTESPYTGPFAGRFVSLKWDQRLFLLSVRAPLEVYPAIAEDFFLAMSQFQPADTTARIPLAQEAVRIAGAAPIAWQTILPDSWKVTADLNEPGLCSFQARCSVLQSTPDLNPFGHLSFTMADRALASDPRDAAQKFIEAAAEGGARLEDAWFSPQTPPAPFKSAWLMHTPGTLRLQSDGREIETDFVCRILEHDKAWFTAGLTSPRRQQAPVAWMHNRRSIDLLCAHLELFE